MELIRNEKLDPTKYIKIEDVLSAIDNADLRDIPLSFRKTAQNNIKDKLLEKQQCSKIEEISEEEIYKKVWKEHVIEDIENRLEHLHLYASEEAIEYIAGRYVYEGDYDDNLSYWDNIDALINEVTKDLEEKDYE